MPSTRITRCLAAWTATFAILLGALAPALSHALPYAASGKHTVQVCTVAGIQTVVVDDSRDAGGSGGDRHLFPSEHCAFCATHGGAAALLPAPAPPFVPKPDAAAFPASFPDAPRPLFVRAASQPRAPPAFA